MATSKLTRNGRTTVPKQIREALGLKAGDKLSWDIRDGNVIVARERPAFWQWEGFIKVGKGDVVKDVAKARKQQERD